MCAWICASSGRPRCNVRHLKVNSHSVVCWALLAHSLSPHRPAVIKSWVSIYTLKQSRAFKTRLLEPVRWLKDWLGGRHRKVFNVRFSETAKPAWFLLTNSRQRPGAAVCSSPETDAVSSQLQGQDGGESLNSQLVSPRSQGTSRRVVSDITEVSFHHSLGPSRPASSGDVTHLWNSFITWAVT